MIGFIIPRQFQPNNSQSFLPQDFVNYHDSHYPLLIILIILNLIHYSNYSYSIQLFQYFNGSNYSF